MPNPKDKSDDILWVEWAKSRARAVQCQEEVLLLKEEIAPDYRLPGLEIEVVDGSPGCQNRRHQ